MNTHDVDEMMLSGMCLGGGKFVDVDRQAGYMLIEKALSLGVNLFDTHHRYGISQQILGLYADMPAIKIMSKISAYKYEERVGLLINMKEQLGRQPDIMWVSDLDDTVLYRLGERIYGELINKFKRVGITTESAQLGYQFLKEYPECKFYMVPYFLGKGDDMKGFCNAVKAEGKYLFIIKPFNDGVGFNSLSKDIIERNFEFIIEDVNPNVICFGSKNINHIEETIKIYSKIKREKCFSSITYE